MDDHDDRACAEGDDLESRPLRALLFGTQFVSIADDGDGNGFCASGINCVQTLASRLLAAGFDADRPLFLFRANQPVGRTTIAQAANINLGEHN